MIEFIVKYWVQALFGLIISGLGALFAWLRKKFKEQNAVKNGVQCILRNDIIQIHDKHMEREFIPIYALDNVIKMYDAYHELGGNGTVTKLIEELKELPTEPPKNKGE